MSQSFEIAFDEWRIDDVTLAVLPVDRATRVPVRSGVKAYLWDIVEKRELPPRLIHNHSGYFVLINQEPDADYTIRIEPEAAGYRGPVEIAVNPHRDGMRQIAPLERRPDRPFDEGTTLVRGDVIRFKVAGDPDTRVPVADVTVSVPAADPADPPPFWTTTDSRGVFALALQLPPPNAGEAPRPVAVTLRFQEGAGPPLDVTRSLTDGRTHVFADPIDIDGDPADQPDFAP